MGTYKGNTEVVKKNAAKIADKLRHGDSIEKLRAEYHVNFYCLKKTILSKMSMREWKKLRLERLLCGGMETRFKKGVVSFRPPKGIHYSTKTEFKKGHLPSDHKPVGTITIRKDKCGKRFRWIKISGIMKGVHKWIPYARYIWEQQNGPVPEDLFVGHKNGRTLNDRPGNLHLVNRSEHIAKMKRLNPDWIKKSSKSRIKTCATRRRKKQIILAAQTRIKCQQAKQKRIDRADAQKVNEFFGGNGETVTRWQCCGCGHDHPSNPGICDKCNGLHFEKIEVPVLKKQKTETLTEAA